MDIRYLFLLFFIYSVIGWALEVINSSVMYHKSVNRGFLIGPYCPIYGFGSILMTLFISPQNDIIATFLKSMAICSILEYFTSYIMEKLFKTRWWDYTKYKFNINGRICLQTMTLFGIAGVIIVEYASPAFIFDLNQLPSLVITILSIVLFIVLMIDLIVSYNIINSFKKIPRTIKKDSTEDITTMVRKVLTDKNYLYNRVVSSFPNFQSLSRKYDYKINKQLQKIEKEKIKLKKIIKKEKQKDRK